MKREDTHQSTRYILSSNIFKTKTAAVKRLQGWANDNMLRIDCRIYEVEIKKVYQPFVVKEIKLREEHEPLIETEYKPAKWTRTK
jgi:hypothetical protein